MTQMSAGWRLRTAGTISRAHRLSRRSTESPTGTGR